MLDSEVLKQDETLRKIRNRYLMKDILIVLVGPSGAGKTKIAEYLKDNYDFKILQSYTTRPKRADSIDDHIYITLDEKELIPDKVAINNYNGNWYFSTKEQCDMSDVYVCDVVGLKMLKENYKQKKILALYVETSFKTRIDRMKLRGDTEDEIRKRIYTDSEEFKKAIKWCDGKVNNDFDLCIAAEQILSKLEQYNQCKKVALERRFSEGI